MLRAQDNETDSELKNISNFYLPVTSFDSIVQDKRNENGYLNQSSKLTYTEPIFEKLRLQVEYLFQNNRSDQEINTTDRLSNLQIDTLSNNFDNLRLQHRGTAVLKL